MTTATKAIPKRARQADLDGLRARLESLGLTFAAEALSNLLTRAVKDEQSAPHFLESLLEERLTKNHVKVQWNHRVQDVRVEGDELVTEIARLDQAPSGYPIARVEWVVDKVLETRSAFVIGLGS